MDWRSQVTIRDFDGLTTEEILRLVDMSCAEIDAKYKEVFTFEEASEVIKRLSRISAALAVLVLRAHREKA